MLAEPEFWVAVGFVILMGVFAYIGVHRTVLTALDHRSERIKSELDDARRLKQEAAGLLEEYKARRASAEREAQDIIAAAKADAERIAAETKTQRDEFVARRTTTAERPESRRTVATRPSSAASRRSFRCARAWV